MSGKYWSLLFLTAVLLLFFANGSLLITDSVESNYALTAKEMVLSGDWLSPQIYGNYWYDKPVFFYWLTAAAFKIFGFTEFAARFFPAVFGILALGLVGWGGSKLYGERSGFYSALVLMSSVEFFLISKSVITDSVFFFFFSAVLLFFYLGYRDGKTAYWYIMYAAAGFAVLTKGPIGVLLPGLIITLFLLWQRNWRVLAQMRLGSGVLLWTIITVPWYTAMYYLHGSDFINTFFGIHNFLRATVSEHPRDDVFYYYTMINALALFPWTALIPWGLYRHYHRHGLHIEQQSGFLLLWAGVVFIFFQCMATKYITYTYPLLFPTALLLGQLIERCSDSWYTAGYKFILSTGFFILLIAAWWVSDRGLLAVDYLYLLPLSLIIAIIIICLLQRYFYRQIYTVTILSAAFYLALIFSIAVPLSEQRSAKNLGQMLEQQQISDIGVYGKYPTSAVFYSGSRIVKLLPERDVAGYVPQNFSWSGKNVMPYTVLEANPYNRVLVSAKSLSAFRREAGWSWRTSICSGEWLLLTM